MMNDDPRTQSEQSCGAASRDRSLLHAKMQALDCLATHYALLSGTAFYQAVCRHLAEALELDMVCVGRLEPGGETVAVVAGWAFGQPLASYSYRLEGTPCAEVVGWATCIHPAGVASRFPDDPELAANGIESYCGVPLFARDGSALGLIVGLGRRPLRDCGYVCALIELFDDRVSAEMQRERAEAALTRRVAFERLVSGVASELILACPEQLDAVLIQALGEIGEFAAADRVYVFQMTVDGGAVDNTHEWCAPGIEPQRESLQGIPFDDRLMFSRRMRRFEIVDIPRVEDLADEDGLDRKILAAQSIQSLLAVPMAAEGRLIGFIGLDSVRTARVWSDEEKTLLTLAGNAITGVLERKRAHDTLRDSEARYRLVVESVKEVIFQTDAGGCWTFLNSAWADVTGHRVGMTLGTRFLDYVHPDDREQHRAWFERLIRREAEACCLVVRYLRIGGGFCWVEVNARSIADTGGSIVGISGTLNDVTAQKEHESQLEYIAHYDALTGLPNRVLLHDRLQRSMVQARRRGQQLAVAYIDLDGFKAINDVHGHRVGDQLLTVLATRMKAVLREGDSVSRLGGDEFVAVLVDLADLEAGLHLIQRLLSAVAQSVPAGGRVLKVSASIGLTLYPQSEEVDADQLLRQADLAMYQAKLAGKNRYHIFDTAQDRCQRGRHESLARIRQGLEAGEFMLLYQPKVNMRTGLLSGLEALIRWRHPEQGELEPASFLPVLEDHPLSVELGEWVIENALEQIGRWKRAGFEVQVSVNISARHLQSPDFMARLQSMLIAHPELGAGSLELEVLETSALESMSQVSRIVEECAGIGVSFALDDFGTGYSSLAYLKRLPAAKLKVDQLFVRNMLDDPDDLAILEAILGLAHAFRREVIAEGVESVQHGKLLLQLGCELGQGYGISRPLAGDAVPLWAAAWSLPVAWRDRHPVEHDYAMLLRAQVEQRAMMNRLAAWVADDSCTPPPPVFRDGRLLQWLERLQVGSGGRGGHEIADQCRLLYARVGALLECHWRQDRAGMVRALDLARRQLRTVHARIQRLVDARRGGAEWGPN